MPSAEILFLIFHSFYFVCLSAPKYMWTTCVQEALEVRKWCPTLLNWNYRNVSYHVGLGSQTQVLCKSNKALLPLSLSLLLGETIL